MGVNNTGFGAYADGFIPSEIGAAINNLPSCVVADDFTNQLGDPGERRLAAVLQYRSNGICPAATVAATSNKNAALIGKSSADPVLMRSPLRENHFIRTRAFT